MFHQYWQTRAPMSLFEQTQNEVEELFYATFPAARDAACNELFEQRAYDLPSPVDYPTLHAATQPFEYDIRNELEIGSSSVPFRGPNQELSYPESQFTHSEGLHPQQPFLTHHQIQPAYYSPLCPIENEPPVYIPPRAIYHHPSDPIPQHIPRSQLSTVPAREPTKNVAYQPSNIPPQVTTDIQETDVYPVTPRQSFRQLNRHMKPPTLKFPNDCQLGVMRLDRLADRSDLNSPQLSRSHPPSETSPTPGPSTTPTTEFLSKSAPSPSIGLSSIPSRSTPVKKPLLACLFCRGRKIACGAPLPGIQKTCNQCRKRNLTCHYPTESRRGMRKKPPSDDPEGDAEMTTKKKKRKKIDK